MYWRSGWFYHLENIPLSEEEKHLDYAFCISDIGEKCRYVDEIEKRLQEEPKTSLVSIYGINTDIGIGIKMRKALILAERFEEAGIILEGDC